MEGIKVGASGVGRVEILALLTTVAMAGPMRTAEAQEVRSFHLSGAPRIDGLFVAADGRIFGAGTYAGDEVYLIHPDGSHEVLASGLDGPTDLGMDGAGNLYVTNFNGAAVSRIDPDGNVTLHARVPPGPAGIVVEDDGTAYVTHYGTGAGPGVQYPASLRTEPSPSSHGARRWWRRSA